MSTVINISSSLKKGSYYLACEIETRDAGVMDMCEKGFENIWDDDHQRYWRLLL